MLFIYFYRFFFYSFPPYVFISVWYCSFNIFSRMMWCWLFLCYSYNTHTLLYNKYLMLQLYYSFSYFNYSPNITIYTNAFWIPFSISCI